MVGEYEKVLGANPVQVNETEKALRRALSGAREDSQENGAQDLIRRSLPEGTAFSR